MLSSCFGGLFGEKNGTAGQAAPALNGVLVDEGNDDYRTLPRTGSTDSLHQWSDTNGSEASSILDNKESHIGATAELTEDDKGNKYCNVTLLTLKVTACFTVSTPTAFLNLLAKLGVDVGALKSLNELEGLLEGVSVGTVTQAALSAASSATVNTVVNIVYLGPALEKTAEAIKKVFKNPQRRCKGEAIPANEQLSSVDIISMVWAFGTSMTFAQIAKDTFSFLPDITLGKLVIPASYIPFTLNALTYYATRFNGVNGFLSGLANFKANKFKGDVLNHLLKVKPKDNFKIAVNMDTADVHERINKALIDYLIKLFDEKYNFFRDAEHFAKSTPMEVAQCLTSLISWPLGIATAAAMAPVMATKATQGVESLTGLEIGKADNYQNWQSLIPGYWLGLPTPFFYAKAGTELAPNFLRLLTEGFPKLWHEDRRVALGVHLALMGFYTYMCYVSGAGMQDVVATAIKNGYLKYLGITADTWVASAVAAVGGIGATVVNLNSCVQLQLGYIQLGRLMNQKLEEEDLKKLEHIDYETAVLLLSYDRSINVSSLRNHNYFTGDTCSFFQSCVPSCFGEGLRHRKVANPEASPLVVNGSGHSSPGSSTNGGYGTSTGTPPDSATPSPVVLARFNH